MQCCLVLRRGLAFFLSAIITCCLSPFLAFLFYLHVGSAHERPEIQPECSCECWDGLFKGTFGRGRYKSVYFNMEKTTALLLVLLAVVTVTVVKGATKVTRLAVTGKLRWRLFALLIPTTYLYLLSFWSAFDAINDRFYSSGLLYVAVFLLLLVFSTFIYMHLSESEPSPVLSSFSSSLHLSSFSSFLSFCTPVLTACALVLIAGYLLYLDTSTFRPAKYAYTIPTPCSCSCWDGVFKGRREKGGAKSVYFNVEATTTLLLTLVTCMLIAGNSFVVKAVKSIQAKALRTPLLFAVISTIFPIFYGFWALFNYYNDRIFHLLHSQVYFFLSEVVVACIACAQMSKEDELNPFLLWFGFSIDAVHLIQSMMDQFIANVLFGKGERHQVSRDIGLLLGNVGAMICIGGALVGYYRNAKGLKDNARGAMWRELRTHALLTIAMSVAHLLLLPLIPGLGG
mmetsp:Transcript_30670/g.80135  ORF Transcript_30670/g.80135 Transcript_30670/m.80135 type:complete len:455 (-) Transcript_30670:1674-3038(-)